MSGLSAQKIAMLKGLVSASPDEVVRELEQAVCGERGNGPLAAIGALVEAEAAERALRHTVFEPLIRLFGPPTDDRRPRFPRMALKGLWEALKTEHPEIVAQARSAFRFLDPREEPPEVFDSLCLLAADGLNRRDAEVFASVFAMCESDRSGGGEDLITVLRLAPVVRPPLLSLGDWLQRMTDERRALARLGYRDATNLGERGGALFFEMLAAPLAQPWTILRIISAVVDRPSERYLAASEMAVFGERSLARIEALIAQLRALRPGARVEDGREAAGAVRQIMDAMLEFEESVALTKDGPWGAQLARFRQTMVVTVESCLREIDDAVLHALPTQTLRYSAKLVKRAPKLDEEPDERAVEWAVSLLSLADGVRGCASEAGFGGLRGKILENLAKHIDQYVEDVLEQIRLGDIEADGHARAYLEVAARLLGLARDAASASIVRRRAAAA